MRVIKRNGSDEEVIFDKITKRIANKAVGLTDIIKPEELAIKVISGLYNGVTTVELDTLAAETAAAKVVEHPDFGILAGRIEMSSLHKSTPDTFTEATAKLYGMINSKTGKSAPMLSDESFEFTVANIEALETAIDYSRDFNYDFFGVRTLTKSYLLKDSEGNIIERPQHMMMRVAIGIHCGDIEKVVQTYNLMSEGFFTHATPTLFNAGTPRPQMSSCFLLQMQKDSITGIYDTLAQCAKISQHAGGIGLAMSSIRATGSYIKGTNGTSNGIVPMLRVFNDTARYVDQGGGKRKGSFAMYLEPWHADIFDFLDLKKNHGKEEQRARDLFYGLWVCDLFMERVKAGGLWTLMCPSECPGLQDAYGDDFKELYEKYEADGKGKKTIKAQELWFKILESQIETGTPYMLYKDAANKKSNQKNLGTIKSSNLCCEIIEYTDPGEVAVCNLASLALPKFVTDGNFDHKALFDVAFVATTNLNKVIDRNYYPVPEAAISNRKHRPIGVGVQGLADVFMLLDIPFDSVEARKLNAEIFETIYFAAMSASCELASVEGPYDSYAGSPISKGIFQYDEWGVTPSTRWDWGALKEDVATYGVRNSLLVAPMPTASTAQILGNNECFEPYTTNIFTRRVLAGDFVVINKHLVLALLKEGLWDDNMRQKLMAANGSVQNIPEIPTHLKEVFKTVWEISQKALIDMSADRGAFICQSQSLNIFMKDANFGKLTSMHFYGWEKGLKTGMYYLRSQAATDAIKFTLDKTPSENFEAIACSIDNPDDCEACGS